jgi:predicted nucleic acid-binding Zn ribbon protein
MFCENCGAKIEDGETLCPNCKESPIKVRKFDNSAYGLILAVVGAVLLWLYSIASIKWGTQLKGYTWIPGLVFGLYGLGLGGLGLAFLFKRKKTLNIVWTLVAALALITAGLIIF